MGWYTERAIPYSHKWKHASYEELKKQLDIQKKELQFDHPWRVRPTTAGRSRDLSDAELERLRTEQGMAAHRQIPWRFRGPETDGDTRF